MINEIFRHTNHNIAGKNVSINFFCVDKLDIVLTKILDENLVSICEGSSMSDTKLVKLRLQDLFVSKENTWKMGAISEFFVHLFIKQNGLKQEFLFLNLEERSIKKGFDGVYSLDNEIWLMESKSGSVSSAQISHISKLEEAYKDLKDKFAGKCKNNPWQNAFSHTNQITVGSDVSIRTAIKKLSDEFIYDNYHKIDEFNIIPCATMFYENQENKQDYQSLLKNIELFVDCLKYKKIIILCISQRSIDIFNDYINAVNKNE